MTRCRDIALSKFSKCEVGRWSVVNITSYASAGIARTEMSVCLSKYRPSYSGIVSKRTKLALCFLHRRELED